jgi:hypothetical protein
VDGLYLWFQQQKTQHFYPIYKSFFNCSQNNNVSFSFRSLHCCHTVKKLIFSGTIYDGAKKHRELKVQYRGEGNFRRLSLSTFGPWLHSIMAEITQHRRTYSLEGKCSRHRSHCKVSPIQSLKMHSCICIFIGMHWMLFNNSYCASWLKKNLGVLNGQTPLGGNGKGVYKHWAGDNWASEVNRLWVWDWNGPHRSCVYHTSHDPRS